MRIFQIISKIRHSATLVAKLPPDLQRHARDSYAIALRAVFIMASVATFLAYLARLPVSILVSYSLVVSNQSL